MGLSGLLLTMALQACAGGDTVDLEADGDVDVGPTPASRSAALDGPVDAMRLGIRFAGDASGQVVVISPPSHTPIAVCEASCSVPLTPGESIELIAVTPSTFGGWGGICTGSSPVCSFTPSGSVVARSTFTRAPAEEWTLLLPDRALSADFDPAGDLVVGTTGGVHKVSATGAPIWFQGAVAGRARVDPSGDVFAVAGQELSKLSGVDGAVLWTRDLGPGGCVEPPRMGHTFETAPGGDVAVQHGSTLRVFDGAGNERWSAPVPASRCVVAVNSEGVIHSGSEDPESFEPTILTRFTADGVRLPDSAEVTPQYQFAMAFDPDDFLLASSAGHSHVDLLRWSPEYEPGYHQSFDNADPDFVDNGVAADATGHAIWAFASSENDDPLEGVVAHWIDPGGTIQSTVIKSSFDENDWTFGVQAYDVAAGDGTFVLAGEFGGAFDDPIPVRGWVQAYRP